MRVRDWDTNSLYPGHAVGILAGWDFACYLQRVEIENDDNVVLSGCDIGA